MQILVWVGDGATLKVLFRDPGSEAAVLEMMPLDGDLSLG